MEIEVFIFFVILIICVIIAIYHFLFKEIDKVDTPINPIPKIKKSPDIQEDKIEHSIEYSVTDDKETSEESIAKSDNLAIVDIFCPNCGTKLYSDSLFCTNCGTPVKEEFSTICPKCKKENDKGSKFCKYCGESLSIKTQQLNKKSYEHNNIYSAEQSTNTVPTKKCPYCLKELPINAKKCTSCGEWVENRPQYGCYSILSIIFFLITLFISYNFNNDWFASFLIAIFGAIGLWIYFLPSWIAEIKQNPYSTAIFVINLLFGWSIIGWFIALVWSFSSGRR